MASGIVDAQQAATHDAAATRPCTFGIIVSGLSGPTAKRQAE